MVEKIQQVKKRKDEMRRQLRKKHKRRQVTRIRRGGIERRFKGSERRKEIEKKGKTIIDAEVNWD